MNNHSLRDIHGRPVTPADLASIADTGRVIDLRDGRTVSAHRIATCTGAVKILWPDRHSQSGWRAARIDLNTPLDPEPTQPRIPGLHR